MDQENFDATASLRIVVDFIRGNVNIEEAKQKLYNLGLNEESIEKVLNDTPRDNILPFKKVPD